MHQPINKDDCRFEQLKGPLRGSGNFIGIGHSSKTMRTFLKELRENGVTLVVDIRGKPQSRFFPRYNRGRLERSLNRAGIEYTWMGETLGNPKNELGERTLEGFRKHQKSKGYREGIAQLLRLAQAQRGIIALLCSERQEEECHRKFILADKNLNHSEVKDLGRMDLSKVRMPRRERK